MLRPPLLCAAAALLVLGLAGCGGDDDASGGRTFTSQQVIRHVQDAAGVQLAVSSASPDDADVLRLPEQLNELYGGFEVYVLEESSLDKNVERLLGDAEPDERGIYWRRDQNAGWIAFTRHGANVILAWFDASERGQVNERWDRLHDVMQRLDEGE